FKEIKRDMPYYQARFHKRLADKMTYLGYQVRVTDKSFEIEGVPQKVIDLFSKQTNEIGQVAKEKASPMRRNWTGWVPAPARPNRKAAAWLN
ncbi:relaxase domain-containing protein, partial [Staphylococcus aureus]|uniref:relaxase domain-containing protein n=1 Tax=Staphylococcus aureus TaxID=1280 RepID=UPI0011F37DC2